MKTVRQPIELAGVSYAHNPYGFCANQGRASLGFNGEYLDAFMSAYFLGNGYRVYSPVLMRFVSPDRYSPFGKGGRNAYVYCLGDPINHVDPSGAAISHRWGHAKNLKLGFQKFDAGTHAPFYGVRIKPGVDPYKLNALHVEGQYGEVLKNLQLGAIGEYVLLYSGIKREVVIQATENMLSLIELFRSKKGFMGADGSGLIAADWRNFNEKILLTDLRQTVRKGRSSELRREARGRLVRAGDEVPFAVVRMVTALKSRLKAMRRNQPIANDDWISEWFNRG